MRGWLEQCGLADGQLVEIGRELRRLPDLDRRQVRPPVHPQPRRTALPTGKPVVFNLINIFRYDDEGRLAEEWIQTDNRSVLRQLGAEGR